MTAFLYKLHRHHANGLPLSRWVIFWLLLMAGLFWLGWLPTDPAWDRPGAVLGVLAAILLIGAGFIAKRRHYVHFRPHPEPQLTPSPLSAQEKTPVWASGRFGVQGKLRQFTWLQGYYRTFATREHAIMCLSSPTRFLLLGRLPEQDLGMWYIFIQPGDMRRVRFGEVRFGKKGGPGLAIDHLLHLPKRGRFRPARTLRETTYLVCENGADAARLLADLRHDLPPLPRATD